jgi:hypothetical protein
VPATVWASTRAPGRARAGGGSGGGGVRKRAGRARRRGACAGGAGGAATTRRAASTRGFARSRRPCERPRAGAAPRWRCSAAARRAGAGAPPLPGPGPAPARLPLETVPCTATAHSHPPRAGPGGGRPQGRAPGARARPPWRRWDAEKGVDRNPIAMRPRRTRLLAPARRGAVVTGPAFRSRIRPARRSGAAGAQPSDLPAPGGRNRAVSCRPFLFGRGDYLRTAKMGGRPRARGPKHRRRAPPSASLPRARARPLAGTARQACFHDFTGRTLALVSCHDP